MFRFNTLGRYVHASLMLGSALALGAAVAAPVNSDSRRFVITAQETWQGMPDMHASAAPRVDALGNALMLAELDAGQVDALGRYVHLQERRCGGFFSFPSRAAAEAFLANDRSSQARQFEPMGGYTIDNANVVNDWLPQVSELNIYNTISHLQAYQNRYYASATGAEAAGWIRDAWLALANGRSDVSAELFTACGDCGGQPSVILTIQGTTLPNEVVVLGGHLDSINHVDNLPPATERAPGADDDASGIASLTEILRVAMASNFRPQRTVKFMGYAAEEVGLNGSQAIAQSFQADGVNVVGALQLDMTNYHEPGQVEIEVINDFTSSTLNAFMGQLFDAYLAPLGMSRGSSPCGYACSDHASWTSSGYPSSFVFEGAAWGMIFSRFIA
jgi:leucyl aminopeptidase